MTAIIVSIVFFYFSAPAQAGFNYVPDGNVGRVVYTPDLSRSDDHHEDDKPHVPCIEHPKTPEQIASCEDKAEGAAGLVAVPGIFATGGMVFYSINGSPYGRILKKYSVGAAATLIVTGIAAVSTYNALKPDTSAVIESQHFETKKAPSASAGSDEPLSTDSSLGADAH